MRLRVASLASLVGLLFAALTFEACVGDDPATNPTGVPTPAQDGGGSGSDGGGPPSGSASLAISPGAIAFPVTVPGATSATKSVTITNKGASISAPVEQAALTGDNRSSFKIAADGCVGKALAAADSCTIDVAFTPVAEGPQVAALAVGSLGTDLTGTSSLFVPESTTDGVANSLRAVYVQDDAHVYAVGDNGRVIVSNGTTWTPQSAPAGSNQLRAVYSSEDGHVYVGGAGPTLIVQAPGATGFATVTLPAGATVINAIWATPPGAQQGNVIAMGEGGKWVSFNQGATPTLLRTYSVTTAVDAVAGHHDSTGGGSYSVCAGGANDTVAYLTTAAGSDFMAATTLTPSGRVLTGGWTDGSTYVFVGHDGAAGAIARGTGTCTGLSTESTAGSALAGIWGTAPNDLWAVGAGGTILRSTSPGMWTKVESGTTKDLRAVFGSSNSNLYIVGDGVILHKTS